MFMGVFCSKDQNATNTDKIQSDDFLMRKVTHFLLQNIQNFNGRNHVCLFFSTQSWLSTVYDDSRFCYFKNTIPLFRMTSAFCSEDWSPVQTGDIKPVAFCCWGSITPLFCEVSKSAKAGFMSFCSEVKNAIP